MVGNTSKSNQQFLHHLLYFTIVFYNRDMNCLSLSVFEQQKLLKLSQCMQKSGIFLVIILFRVCSWFFSGFHFRKYAIHHWNRVVLKKDLKSLIIIFFFVCCLFLKFVQGLSTTFKMEEQSLDCRWCPTKTPELLFKSRRQQRGPESQKWGGGGRGRFTAAKCWRAWGRFLRRSNCGRKTYGETRGIAKT